MLDEPTNDLDIETLDLLEELLLEFGGTLLLVSHDRAFLDAVVTSTLVMEGDGRVGEYAGGYADWLRQRAPEPPPAAQRASTVAPTPARTKSSRPRRLTYAEREELDALPDRIDAMEQERAALYLSLADPDVLRDGDAVVRTKARLEELGAGITSAMTRWEELEGIAAG